MATAHRMARNCPPFELEVHLTADGCFGGRVRSASTHQPKGPKMMRTDNTHTHTRCTNIASSVPCFGESRMVSGARSPHCLRPCSIACVRACTVVNSFCSLRCASFRHAAFLALRKSPRTFQFASVFSQHVEAFLGRCALDPKDQGPDPRPTIDSRGVHLGHSRNGPRSAASASGATLHGHPVREGHERRRAGREGASF